MLVDSHRKRLKQSPAGCKTSRQLGDCFNAFGGMVPAIRRSAIVPLMCLTAFWQPSPGNAQSQDAQSQEQTAQSLASKGLDQAPVNLADGWNVTKPSSAGLDPEVLAKLARQISTGEIHNVHAVIIEHAGNLVYEQYNAGPDFSWGEDLGHVAFNRDSLHDLRSVTKSITTALLGIALAGKHREALEKPVIEYFPELKGKTGQGVEDITLKHVVTMTAGLEWNEMTVPYTDEANDENQMDYSEDPIAMILARPIRDPVGTQWYYNGGLSK